MRDAIAYVHGGKIGKVDLGLRHVLQAAARASARWTGPTEPPETMDYDLWCGPASRRCPVKREAPPLRLALGLGVRQRRLRQPGRPRGGQGPVGARASRPAASRGEPSAAGSGTSTTARRRTPSCAPVRLRRRQDDVRGPRAEDRGLQGGEGRQHLVRRPTGYVVCPSYASGVAYDKDGKKVAEFKRRRRPAPLRQLREGRPRAGNPAEDLNCRRRRGAPVGRPVPPGEHQLPARPAEATDRQGPARRLRPATRRPTPWPGCRPHLEDNKVDLADRRRPGRAEADDRPEDRAVHGRRRGRPGGGQRPAVPRVPQGVRGEGRRLTAAPRRPIAGPTHEIRNGPGPVPDLVFFHV